MTKLAVESASFDLVVHSDTLEHVEYPITALSECRRVLSSAGRCIFTVPVVVDRLTRSRAGLNRCYHGSQDESGSDYLVRTEFGSDVWKYVVEAGFQSSTFHCVDYPAGIAIEARV
jgi:ubiquinone/menaquinone biosynthesis C-methylase UbiE